MENLIALIHLDYVLKVKNVNVKKDYQLKLQEFEWIVYEIQRRGAIHKTENEDADHQPRLLAGSKPKVKKGFLGRTVSLDQQAGTSPPLRNTGHVVSSSAASS